MLKIANFALTCNAIMQRHFTAGMEKRFGVYSYKIKKQSFKLYRNPHLIPLKLRETLYKVFYRINNLKA